MTNQINVSKLYQCLVNQSCYIFIRLDCDVLAFLDVEIWKASTAFASTIVPEDE